jgi:hypothetical protein
VLAPVCPKDGHRRQQYDFRSGATCAAAYFRSLVRRHVRPAVHSIRCSIKLKHIKLITFGSIRRCRLTHIHCICCILQSYNNYIINCSHLMESPREYTLHSGTVWIMSLLFSVVCAGVIILSRKTCLAIRLEFFFFFLRRLLNNYFSVGAQSRGTVSLGEQCHLTGLILKGIFKQIFVRCLPSLSLPLSCMFGLRLHKVLLYRESKMYCRSAPGVRCKKGNENNRSNENLTMPANT